LEAAEVDGAGPFRQFMSILLPSIFPTISTFLITGIAGIFINQGGLYDFYANGALQSSYTLGYYLFVKVVGSSSGKASYPYAAAAGLLMTLVAVPLTLLMKFVLEKFGPSED
jgi:ABC-type sugar transport system permease subunit